MLASMAVFGVAMLGAFSGPLITTIVLPITLGLLAIGALRSRESEYFARMRRNVAESTLGVAVIEFAFLSVTGAPLLVAFGVAVSIGLTGVAFWAISRPAPHSREGAGA